MKVLFVEDDNVVRNELQCEIEDMANQWDMYFSPGGEHALEILGRQDFDVVVSDLTNENMSGVEFMQKVQELHPGAARIILSEHASDGRLYRLADSDNFYLQKPCPKDVFVERINESPAVHETLFRERKKLDADDLTEILTEYFTHQILTQKHSFSEIPEKIRPYLPNDLVEINTPSISMTIRDLFDFEEQEYLEDRGYGNWLE